MVQNQNSTLESPFFPNFYPRDLMIEYVVTCNTSETDDCRLEIMFSDFQISTSSTMEVNENWCIRVRKHSTCICIFSVSFMTAITMNQLPSTLAKFFVHQSFTRQAQLLSSDLWQVAGLDSDFVRIFAS